MERTHDKVRGLCWECCRSDWRRGRWPAPETGGRDVPRLVREDHVQPFRRNPVLDSRVSVHLYRIAQEAVANALRHSGAKHVRIILNQEQGGASLRIEDDGKGLSEPRRARAEGMGGEPLRYCAEFIGAQLEMIPARGERRSCAT